MKHLLTYRVLYSLLMFVLIFCLVIIIKPRIIFDDDGTPKSFGLDKHQTLISLGLISTVVPISMFYLFASFDLQKYKQDLKV